MAYSKLKKVLLALATTVCFSAIAEDVVIPDLGPAGVRGMSVIQEKNYGGYFIRKANGAGIISSDPVLTEYINTVGQNLVMHAQNVYFPFEFFLSADRSLNASAFLGGKVQVNAGLFHYAENEDEFASVLAHEVTHVTQRHIARFIEDQMDRSSMTIASIVGAIAIALINPTIGAAAITSTTGALAQANINFTRYNESEADRIGLQVLYNSGYNPMAMSELFRKLLSMQGNLNPAFAMLIDHPLSEIRVAEAYNAARLLPKRNNSKNPNYMFAKARVDVRYMNYDLKELEKRIEKSTKVNEHYRNYALALINLEKHNFDVAESYLNKLNLPRNDFVLDVMTDIDLGRNRGQNAISRLHSIYVDKPSDGAIVLNLANAYIETKQGNNAVRVLNKYLEKHPDSPLANEMLVRAYFMTKDKCSAYQAAAWNSVLKANCNMSNRFLTDALHLCEGSTREIVRAKFKKFNDLRQFDEQFEKKNN